MKESGYCIISILIKKGKINKFYLPNIDKLRASSHKYFKTSRSLMHTFLWYFISLPLSSEFFLSNLDIIASKKNRC